MGCKELIAYLCAQEMDLKDSEMINLYNSYLKKYGAALEEGATHDCLHPGDLPTVNLLVEIIVHACSYPVSEHLIGNSLKQQRPCTKV